DIVPNVRDTTRDHASDAERADRDRRARNRRCCTYRMKEEMTDPSVAQQRPETSTTPQSQPRTVEASPAVIKFKSCRWRRPPEDGPECCGHRDVLPIAGTSGFDPEAWCPDCQFYKLRRTPKKRSPEEYRY